MSGGSEISLQMTGAKTVTALFSLNQYDLVTSVGTGGTVSGAGTYDHGSVASLVATADEGYSFAGWTINGAEVSGGTEIDVEMTGAKTVTALFSLNQYDLVTSAGTGGTVSGAGTYDHGSVASLVATADVGYSFAGWTIDGAEVSGGSEISLQMTGAKTVTALFSLNQYDLVTSVGTGGTVSGAGTYDHGSVARLVATADEGYSFAGWTINGAEVSGGTEIDVEMTGAKTVTASFSLNQYDLVTSAGPGGTVSGAGTYDHGSVASLVATADVGYSFAGWTIDGAEVSGGSEISLQMTGAKTVTASFGLNQYDLVTSAGPGGTVSGAGTYDHGSVASLVATADVGYSFAGWTIDGAEVSGGTEIDVEMTGAKTVTASFGLNQYDLVTSAGPGGTVSGAGTYDHGSVASLLATADEGYSFAGWTIDGAEVSGGSEISLQMTGAKTITASFSLNQYELVTHAGPGGTVSGAGTYDHGSVWPVWWRLPMKDTVSLGGRSMVRR